MSRPSKTLLLILLIQVGIIAAVYWPQSTVGVKAARPQLMTFGPKSVDEIHISDVPNTAALLVKVGGRWLLPNLGELPADPQMVTKLLDDITGADPGWPVARSAAARQRFQVADYHHQRRLEFNSAGRELATIYLGTSPGFRKVHARAAGGDAIHSIRFNVFDAPGRDSAWVDRKLLQIRTPVSITSGGRSIQRKDGDWRADGDAQPDERELLALLSSLRSLQVEGVAGEAEEQELAASEADLLLEVESLAGNISLGLFTLEGEHYISSSEYPFFFKLSAYDYDRLQGINFMLISGEDTSLCTPEADLPCAP